MTITTGCFYLESGLIEIFWKNIIELSKDGNYKDMFVNTLLHELVHFKHYTNVFGENGRRAEETIKTYEALNKAGFVKLVRDWWHRRRYHITRTCIDSKYGNYIEFEKSGMKDRIEDIDGMFVRAFLYVRGTKKYGNTEELNEIKTVFEDFLSSCDEKACKEGEVLNTKDYSSLIWDEIASCDAGSNNEEGYGTVTEAIAYYTTNAWIGYSERGDTTPEGARGPDIPPERV